MKLLLITGGCRGLGLALCEQYKSRGYTILEFSRSAPHEFSVQTDLAHPEQNRLSVSKAIAAIDDSTLQELVVISNAGTLHPIGPASTKPYDERVENLNINFVSAISVLSEAVVRFQTVPCRKVIANISSGAALRGVFGWSLYCAAKAGMESFIRSLAVEQQAQPHPFIPVNIDPGVIDTEMQAHIRSTARSEFMELERFIQRKEQGLLVPPEQVAAAVIRILALESLSSGERYKTSDYSG